MAKCTAHSKGTGLPCKQPAIAGGRVCRFHGGSAPQVRNKAAMRLATLVDPAVAKLAKIINSKSTGALELRAVVDVLDRNNLRGDNLIRLQNPGAGEGAPVKLTEEQLAMIEGLQPDELQTLLRVLGLITAGPGTAPGPPQLTH